MKTKSAKNKKRRKNRIRGISTLLTVLILFSAIGFALYFFQKPVLVLEDEIRFPVGTKVYLHDLVKEIKHATLVSPNDCFESQKCGSKTIFISYRNRLGQILTETLSIEFYEEKTDPPPVTEPADTTPPVITAPELIRTVVGQSVDVSEGVSAVDEDGTVCTVSLTGEYRFDQAGDYHLTFSATDLAGNTAKKSITLSVLALPYDENGKLIDGTYTTVKGFTIQVINQIAYVEGHLIANKSFSLPKSYTSSFMTPEATAAYNAMKAAAAKDGYTLTIHNAYRSWYDQQYLFNNYSNRDGVVAAETYSARPGHSEHQTGLAMDLITSSTSGAQNPTTAKILAWANENAYKFGFILRYPEGKTDETGYIYESWHFRYVGVDLASKLYNNGNWITMESYFGFDSSYRGYTR